MIDIIFSKNKADKEKEHSTFKKEKINKKIK